VTVYLLVAAAVFGGALGRNDPARLDRPARVSSPMSELSQCAEALRATCRREYPDWSPEADLQRSTVRRLLGESMDYREISQRALGRTWDHLSPRDRDDFVADLAALIERRCLFRGKGIGPDMRIEFQRETVSDRRTAASVFGTVAGAANGKQLRVRVEYRLVWRDGRWAIYDVVTDGDSMLESYRAQFSRIIARESFAGLKKRMKAEALGDDK